LGSSAAGVAYTAFKHAVNGLTKSVAVLYGHKGIRANAVATGAVKTNIEAPFKSEWAQERLGPLMAVIPRLAEAEELAASITWLASSDASKCQQRHPARRWWLGRDFECVHPCSLKDRPADMDVLAQMGPIIVHLSGLPLMLERMRGLKELAGRIGIFSRACRMK
jgi:NAD(P)-dependent dehydrogenase (short-subunit alcohol dehydrogenase family)